MGMMISKRLTGLVPESRRFVAQNVAFQWVSLVANICLISVVCRMLGSIFEHSASTGDFVLTAGALRRRGPRRHRRARALHDQRGEGKLSRCPIGEAAAEAHHLREEAGKDGPRAAPMAGPDAFACNWLQPLQGAKFI